MQDAIAIRNTVRAMSARYKSDLAPDQFAPTGKATSVERRY